MNALVWKWLTASIVGLLVCSAIWLAGSVKSQPSALSHRFASVGGSQEIANGAVGRVPLPVAYAASAALLGGVALR
ncbi:hypothetical protein LNV08_05325 [Paucibacter sp. TC2R-5]|uniref:hypothetical protein n=1 Tax=Paucibacter sp. TC2R-5 TaxID=2893555 RepID=UPI0021E42541|nr:hypothetical protein [Paucibacter sp. TC2R-5]MCV2358391.1 hypothetical protein [Paucibacter sp. TC2R-5]